MADKPKWTADYTAEPGYTILKDGVPQFTMGPVNVPRTTGAWKDWFETAAQELEQCAKRVVRDLNDAE